MAIIAIGTTSIHKIEAAQRALKTAALENVFTITGAKTSSGVPEQPVGFDEIRKGALTRAFGALDAIAEARYALGVENGIVDIGAAGPFIDLAVVVLVEHAASKPVMLSDAIYTTSAGLPCPPKYVRRSFDMSRQKTAGAFIAEDTGCDGTDWHAHFTGGRLPRNTILEQAILAALAIKFPCSGGETWEKYVKDPAKANGLRVRTAAKLERRDYSKEAQASRRPNTEGKVFGHHDSHGLCFDVRHGDNTVGTYDLDELQILGR